MHRYEDLIIGMSETALTVCAEVDRIAQENLKTGARTSDVKLLQRANLLRAVTAIGMFSLTEAMLQDGEDGKGGFTVAFDCLNAAKDTVLKSRFQDYKDAINVLKHGRGSSYERLLKRGDKLPFEIKQPDEAFFDEGDVSEVATLVKIDNDFVRGAAEVIQDVLACVERINAHN